MDYSENLTTSPLPFKLSPPAMAFRNVGTCNQRRVHISSNVEVSFGAAVITTNNVDTFCGGRLSKKQGDNGAGVVRGNLGPFELVTFSRAMGTVAAGVTGYKIDFSQVPCD